MFDEWKRLREDAALLHLLTHYAELGREDRETWRDRVMQLDDLRGANLVQLHGELLANDWIEQNTGATPVLKAGVVAGCYRITFAGRRALRQAHANLDDDDFAEAA